MAGAAPVDVEALGAALADAEVKAAATEARAAEAEAKACNAEAKVSDAEAQIAALKLMIEKLRRELYGRRSERKARLLDQLEMQLDELTATATEDELAAEQAAAGCASVKGFVRRRPARKPFPPDLPRERMVVPAPACRASCGSDRLSKIGEDVTETLEVICAASPASCRPMAFAGYNRLYEPGRSPAPVTEGALLRACQAQVLRACRHRGRQEAWQARTADLAAGDGGREAARCAVRHRSRHKRRDCRTPPRGTPRAERAAPCRVRGLDAHRACRAVASCPRGQGHGRYAEALGRLRPLPRRRTYLPDK